MSRVQADGTVRLVGTGLVTFQLALQTGTGLTCRLSPVPDLSTLPKGPKLQAAKGKIKVGPDPAAADDEVTLTAVVAIGATAPVLDGTQDVLLRLQGATGEAMSVLAPGGKFSVKGKKLTLSDTDGTVIQGMRDQPHSADPDEQPATAPPDEGRIGGHQGIEEARHADLQAERRGRRAAVGRGSGDGGHRYPDGLACGDLRAGQEGDQGPLTGAAAVDRRLAAIDPAIEAGVQLLVHPLALRLVEPRERGQHGGELRLDRGTILVAPRSA